MRQTLLLTLILSLSFLNLTAQDFSFEYVNSERKTFQLSDQQGQDVVIKGVLTNHSNSDIEFTWIREQVYVSENWQTAICDKNRCYLTHINNQTFTLNAGDTGVLDVHLYPFQQEGDSAWVNVKLISSASTGDTTVIPYKFYQENTTSSSRDHSLTEAILYPNPASTYFRVASESVISSVEVFDILGKRVKSVNPNSQSAFVDVIDLVKGIYIVRVKDSDGRIIKTQRLKKEMP